MKKLYILIFGLFIVKTAQAQIGKQWDKTFGGTGYEFVTSTIATSDGGFLLAGYSNSGISGDKSQASQGGYDFWVVRINASGAKAWDKRFGGSGDDVLFSAIQTTDGGYLLGGYSNSAAGGDKSQASQGSYDYWVVKIDANGTKAWDKRFGGSGDDYLTSVLQASDGNYLLSGYSASPASGDKGFDLVGTSGFSDFWVVKIDASGNKSWDNASGTPYADQLLSVVEIDGGFLLGGYYPFGGDNENMDFILIEIEATNGDFVESGDGYFGGDNVDYLTSVIKTADGGYLISGYSNSIASYDKSESPRGGSGYDYWVIKTDSGLEKEWDKTLGGSSDDYLLSAVQTADGGFLLGGQSYSGATNERSEASRGGADFWIIKLNSTGTKQWDKRYGGTGLDALNEIVKTTDGFLLGGYSESGISGDKSQAVLGGVDTGDFWAVKLIDAPVVTSLSPANGVTGVAVSTNLVMTFSESVQKGSGSITINQGTSVVQTIAVSNAAVSVSGTTVTINPPSDLPAGTVNVQMPAGTFKDLANNNYAGITNNSTWAFTTAAAVDATPPAVTTFSPLDGATNVDISTNLSITFNESIQKGTGNILIKNGTTTLQTIDVTTDAVSVAGNTATIDPPVELSAGKAIHIQIAAGAFKDQAGNNYAGIANETTWNFNTIADNTDPSFVSPTPSVSNIGTTTLNIDVKLTEAGKVYYVMVPDGGTAPTPAQVKAGQNSAGGNVNVKGNATVTANTSVSMAVSGLTAGLPYDIYLIAEDNNGNLQDAVTKIDIVTLPNDAQSPTVTTFSPVNNATSVALDANLVITFSENVKAGTGSISVNAAGNTVQTLSVRDPGIVTIAGNVVTINPPNDLPLNRKIDIQMPAGVFTDNTGNKFAGILNGTTWTFTTIALQITQSTLPNLLTSTGGAIANNSASITLNQFPAGSTVHFYSKSISRETFAKKENLTPSSGTTFTEALQDKNADEIGLQYYFEIEPATGFGTKFTSAVTTASIKYTDGLAIPPLLFGTEQKDYQIIAIPLELTNKTTSNVFKALGAYNDTKWRLFSHLNSTDNFQENTKGLSNIEPGTGYWLIMKDNTAINTGEGTTFRRNTDDPFTLILKPGWNLIGNPYNLDVSWTDVKAANNTLTGLGNLRVFEDGTFKDSDVLKKFRGAFVRNESQGDLVVKIPVKRNSTLNGNRVAALQRHHENSLFEVNFSLHSREVGYQLGGLGMHQEAKPGRDVLDDFVLPRFLKYLDLHFPRAGEGKDKLTKDMVPVADSHVWDLSVNTNLINQPVTLNWENYLNHPAENHLYLYDVERKIAINMLDQQTYTFLAKPLTAFKVYYGKPEFISQFIPMQDAGAYSYPNPFTETAIIAFSLPASPTTYSLLMPVYNALGQQVAVLAQGNYSNGFHQVSWNGRDMFGNKLPTGVYTCQVQAVSGDSSKQYTIRLVIR